MAVTGMSALRHATRLTIVRPGRSAVRLLTPSRGLATAKPSSSIFAPIDTFAQRHIGPDDTEAAAMLKRLGYDSMDTFVDDAVPAPIRTSKREISDESIPPLSEAELQKRAKELGAQNGQFKSYIGMGYHNAVVPPVILRNVS
jgi:glycine dehydrogenase